MPKNIDEPVKDYVYGMIKSRSQITAQTIHESKPPHPGLKARAFQRS